MVLPDSDRVSRAPPYSGTDLLVQTFEYEAFTLYDQVSQLVLLVIPMRYDLPHNPERKSFRFGLYRFRSPLLSVSRLISFPPGT